MLLPSAADLRSRVSERASSSPMAAECHRSTVDCDTHLHDSKYASLLPLAAALHLPLPYRLRARSEARNPKCLDLDGAALDLLL